MKNHKLHRFGTVLALIVLLTSLLTVSVFAGNEERYGYSTLEHVLGLFPVENEQFDEELAKLQKLYNDLEAGVASQAESVDADADWLRDSRYIIQDNGEDKHLLLSYMVRLLVDDHPEYYWFEGAHGCSIITQGGAVLESVITLQYKHTSPQEAVAFDEGVNDILEAADISGSDSDYEKAWKLHKALAEHVTYNINYSSEQSAYSAIVNGQAVCAGYARAYQHLLNLEGIKAWTVEGESYKPNTQTKIPHAWTLLWLDENCYYTDVTWDDQGSELYHAYFNNTLDEIELDHVIYEFVDLPTCSHDPDEVLAVNYFVQHGGKDGAIYLTQDTTVDQFIQSAVRDEINNWYFFDIYCAADLNEWLASPWCDEYDDLYGDFIDSGLFDPKDANKLTELVWKLEINGVSFQLYGLGAEVKFYLLYENPNPNPGENPDPEEPEQPEDPYENMKEFDGRIEEQDGNTITAYVSYEGVLTDGTYNVWVGYYKNGAFAGVTMTTLTLAEGHGALNVECPDSFTSCIVFAVREKQNPAPLCDALELRRPAAQH